MSNPYEAPKTSAVAPTETEHDAFIRAEAGRILEPGERLLWTAYVLKAPALIWQILFSGLIMLFLIKHNLAAVTDRRIILMRTKSSWVKPKLLNLEQTEIRWAEVASLQVGGIANNRSLTFHMRDGTKRTFRIGPWAKFVSGQKPFFEFCQSFDPDALARVEPSLGDPR